MVFSMHAIRHYTESSYPPTSLLKAALLVEGATQWQFGIKTFGLHHVAIEALRRHLHLLEQATVKHRRSGWLLAQFAGALGPTKSRC